MAVSPICGSAESPVIQNFSTIQCCDPLSDGTRSKYCTGSPVRSTSASVFSHRLRLVCRPNLQVGSAERLICLGGESVQICLVHIPVVVRCVLDGADGRRVPHERF